MPFCFVGMSLKSVGDDDVVCEVGIERISCVLKVLFVVVCCILSVRFEVCSSTYLKYPRELVVRVDVSAGTSCLVTITIEKETCQNRKRGLSSEKGVC